MDARQFVASVPRTAWLLSLAVLPLAACRKKPAAPPPSPEVAVVSNPSNTDSLDRAEAARRDSLAREARLRAEREQRIAAARATLQQPVYFDTDRSDLSPDSRRTLDAKLELLMSTRDVRLRIAGHADERGSDEYNLALGQSRAAAAKRYLVDHGIDAARLDVMSLGEERPVCTTAAESCWSRNRRAEFEITAGSDRLAAQ